MRRFWIYCTASILGIVPARSQDVPRGHDDVVVDSSGVLRWKESQEEVRLYGVNYTTPFAYSYRAHKRLGLSIRKAIDLDVAHLARLDLDAFRVHVWDREISDARGNLLENEHLDLFDYLLSRLADRGFKVILTPIAWWGTGWPEPDEPTLGFSQKYTKVEMITDPRAREAQRNYLAQFIRHRNPYRNLSYEEDPSIIAVEVINEPHHPNDAGATKDYISEMAGVLRKAGCAKPIFYNISENWNPVQAEVVAQSPVDGVSFQWYPTGLVHNAALVGNYLVNVNKYAIPSDSIRGLAGKARMVYEFDAADVGMSTMYPAMARSFRESGMQFATMFSYDPVQIAWSNTEYPTHFLNLLYTPAKALSLMIAAKAFRQLPRMRSYGDYPENNRFGDFSVNYPEDRSEMNSATEFIYTNSTKTLPENPAMLELVAGCGSSPVVHYDGTGAYFLERLEPGVWRLELNPDVLWLSDPFGSASMSRQAARLFWQPRSMAISLPDLGTEYIFRPLSRADVKQQGGQHTVTPGVYLVTAKRVGENGIRRYRLPKVKFLEGLYTPPAPSPGVYVVNKSSRYAVELQKPEFRFQIAGERDISGATLYIRRPGWRGFARHPLRREEGFTYVPADTFAVTPAGPIEYCVAVGEADSTYVFPGGLRSSPARWDFSSTEFWGMRVIGKDQPLDLFDAARDRKDVVLPRRSPSMSYDIDYRNGSRSEETSLALNVRYLRAGGPPFGMQVGVAPLLKPVAGILDGFGRIHIKACATGDSTSTIGVTLMMSDGECFSAGIELSKSWAGSEIPLSAFRRTSALILPDAYPLFLPRVWNPRQEDTGGIPDLRHLEALQITIEPTHSMGDHPHEIGVEIVSISLSR